MDTLKLIETEWVLWAEEQPTIIQRDTQTRQVEAITLPSILDRWCFTDASWKDQENLSGQGCYSTLKVLSYWWKKETLEIAFHKVEALIWAMKCMKNLHQFQVTFATDSSQLVKMVSELEELPAFANYSEDIKILKGNFHTSELIHIPRSMNSKWTVLHIVLWSNLLLSLIWMPSYLFGFHSLHESLYLDDNKELHMCCNIQNLMLVMELSYFLLIMVMVVFTFK